MKSLGFLLSYLSAPMRHRNVRFLVWLLLTFVQFVFAPWMERREAPRAGSPWRRRGTRS